ncbi:MAG: RNA-binding domain-containing protein [Pseudohongiellaceae bacterium]
MNIEELKEIISKGEDSRLQFKSDVKHADSLSAEIVAFSNSEGGLLLIGVNDDHSITGLSAVRVEEVGQLLSDVSLHNIKPSVVLLTENVLYMEGKVVKGTVIAVTIDSGPHKPYRTKSGVVWIKAGANKRRATTDDLLYILQQSGLLYGEEMPARGTSIKDINRDLFEKCCNLHLPMSTNIQRPPLVKLLEAIRMGDVLNAARTLLFSYMPRFHQRSSLEQLLEILNLTKDDTLNVAGALLFTDTPQFRLPIFIVKALCFSGTTVTDTDNIYQQDISGNLSDMYQMSIEFVLSNIHHKRNEQGEILYEEPEVPETVLTELITNALVHRDYIVKDHIKIMIFTDRIEIISPGHLPGNLTSERIKKGERNVRNEKIAFFAPSIMPYMGVGSGIQRALEHYPDIEFIDDRDGNRFKVIIRRRNPLMSDKVQENSRGEKL